MSGFTASSPPQQTFNSPGCWGWASSGVWGAPLCCTAQTPPCGSRFLSAPREAAPGPAAQYWEEGEKVQIVRKAVKRNKRDETREKREVPKEWKQGDWNEKHVITAENERRRENKTLKDGSSRGDEGNLLPKKKEKRKREMERSVLGFGWRWFKSCPTHSRRMLFMSRVKNFFLPSWSNCREACGRKVESA